MSRIELAMLNAEPRTGVDRRAAEARRQAIACYLSAGEGWRDALRVLDGTFAALRPREQG